MGGAIWSTSTARMLDFPASSFVAFFRNHDLMTGLDPAQRWRTVEGGSREYVRRLVQALGPRASLGVGAQAVTRGPEGVRIRFSDGSEGRFDQVILATHADVSLGMLHDADAQERSLLGAIRYADNRAVLHSDPALMPRRRKVWSSWNFLSQGAAADAHPLYDGAAFEAQSGIESIQGRGGVWHAGAWLGWGFHEDGLRAGLRAAMALGARPAWARETGAPIVERFAATAAE